MEPVEFYARYVAECLDRRAQSLACIWRKLWKRIKRKLAGNFQLDQRIELQLI